MPILANTIKHLRLTHKLPAGELALATCARALVDRDNNVIPQVATGNILWVDADNGNDVAEGLPYQTLSAAKADAVSGDLIRVAAGTYAVTAPILKNGVNWHFENGASVTRTLSTVSGTTQGLGILDDNGDAVECAVTGDGIFTVILNGVGAYAGPAHTSHASSHVSIHARRLVATQTNVGAAGAPIGVYSENGTLFAECSEFIYCEDNSGSGYGLGVYWERGNCYVRAPHIAGTNTAVCSNASAVSPGYFYVTADLIEGTAADGLDNPGVIVDFSSNASAATWINAKIVKSNNAGIDAVRFGAGASLGGRLYVQAQKIFGRVTSDAQSGALLYVDTDKVSAVGNGGSSAPGLFYSTGGVARVFCNHWDAVTFTGEMIKVTGGTARLQGGDFVGGSSAKGVEITGGTLRLRTIRLDTSANSSTSPLTKSGGTLILEAGTVLVAEGTQDSISAATAQDVKVYPGCCANKAVDSDVTEQVSTLTIDSAVS